MSTEVLKTADSLIHGDRAKAYGHPHDNATVWAQLFSAATGLYVIAEHYPISQICVKLARQRSKHKQDNLVDIAGYVGVWDMIIKREEEVQRAREGGIILPVGGAPRNQGIS